MSSEYKFTERDPSLIQQATLCFLVKDNKVLLAMKKRGFAEGLWNGAGGKIKDEEIEEGAKRETKEEIDIDITEMEKVAVLHFYFPKDPIKDGWNQDVHVFIVREWSGEPKETEEMKPRWFDIDKLSFEKMWSDDSLWLPRVLTGEKIEGWFAMDDNNGIEAYKIKELKDVG